MFVMIILATLMGSVSVATAEFTSKSACEAAIPQVMALHNRTRAICVPK
jgi:hypothetical protein